MQVVRFLAATHRTSLLDRDEDTWRRRSAGRRRRTRNPRALLIYAQPQGRGPRRRPAAGRPSTAGMSGSMRRLGFAGHQTLRLRRHPQPWLRELVKRWVRWRISTGLGLEVARRGLRALTRFARFLRPRRCHHPGRGGPACAGALPGRPARRDGRQPAHGDHIGQLNNFFARDPPAPLGRHPAGRPRCCSPTTTPNAPNGCPGHWPSRSWPRSSTPTTSTGGTTRPTGWSP